MRYNIQFNLRTVFYVLFLFLLLPIFSIAQTTQLPYHIKPYSMESGVFNGDFEIEAADNIAFDGVVQVADAPWLKLTFSSANLGEDSYLILRSVLDGKWQRLNAVALEQWQNSSAFFNGDAVEIELHVAADDKGVYVNIADIIVGEQVQEYGVESQCGPTDDRVASSDDRACRLLNIGCTAWLITNGKLVSAGHCVSSNSLLNTLEFNVPPSLANGTLQHPGPEDQYAVNTATKVFSNGGIGNDWGVFEAFPNSNTGLTPLQAQGVAFTVVQNLGPSTIRITGYGVDGGTANQTQQTSIGPNAGSSGTTMRYVCDTEGGNSGSPIIDEATGNSVGVHTNGGCTTGGSGSNSGTSAFNTAFWNALNAGSTNPNVTCTITLNPTSGNGTLAYTMSITNNEATNQAATVWVVVTGPNGFNQTIFNRTMNLKSNRTLNRSRNYTIPVSDLGAFTFTINVGTNPTPIWDTDAKIYTKTSLEKQIVESAENLTSNPENMTLIGNYPNPFNPTTNIKYALNEDASVSIKIYNSLGQEVATLVDGFASAGYYEAVWDGRNEFGDLVSSGIYFYRMTTGNFVQVKKMLLNK
ncbi:MAG: T9SS type A sorting domain-containing protein [Ignavibacteriales bacterium]|nr:T9SS type A sorting domain-containing protein [Ignavibacteriales bacterium]